MIIFFGPRVWYRVQKDCNYIAQVARTLIELGDHEVTRGIYLEIRGVLASEGGQNERRRGRLE